MHIQQVTAVARVEYIAGIGHGGAGLGQRGELFFADAPLAAILHMQAQLNIDNGFQAVKAVAQLGDVTAFVGGERVGPSEVDQKQIILLQVMAKDRKSTRLNSSHVASSYAVVC